MKTSQFFLYLPRGQKFTKLLQCSKMRKNPLKWLRFQRGEKPTPVNFLPEVKKKQNKVVPGDISYKIVILNLMFCHFCVTSPSDTIICKIKRLLNVLLIFFSCDFGYESKCFFCRKVSCWSEFIHVPTPRAVSQHDSYSIEINLQRGTHFHWHLKTTYECNCSVFFFLCTISPSHWERREFGTNSSTCPIFLK